jgi:hypothetical protein
MRFLWMPKNTSHVTRHVPRQLAEKVFSAPDFERTITQLDSITSQGYGTVDGVRYFLVFQITLTEDPPSVYIVTCYRKGK